MKKMKFFIIFTLLACLLATCIVYSQEKQNDTLRIEVNIPSCTLSVYKNGIMIAHYFVAVGSPKTPTPFGQYYIASKERDPIWYPPPKPVKKVDDKGNEYIEMEHFDPVPAGPDNPLGKYWMGLDRNELGIHSTNNPSSIGYSVSHGCIRMHPNDVPKLFDIVKIGDIVDIVYKTTETIVDPNTGTIYLAAYPDIYSRGTESFNDVKTKFDKTGIPYDKKLLKETIDTVGGKFVMISTPFSVSLEGEKTSIKAIYPIEKIKSDKKDFYISQKDWNLSSEQKIEWNSGTGKANVNGKDIDSVMYQGRNYVNGMELAKILDMEYIPDLKERNINFYSVLVYFNGHLMNDDAKLINKNLYISVKRFSDELGIKFSWNSAIREAGFGDTSFKCVLSSGKAFVPVEKLVELFTLQMNKKGKRTIELNYPVISLNGINLEKKSFLYHGEIYVSLRELGNIAGMKFEWKPKEKSVVIGSKNIAGKEFGDTGFLPISSIYKIAFVDVTRPRDTSIEITLTKVIINNNFFSVEAYKDGSSGEIMILMDDLAKAANINFLYDPNSKTIRVKENNLAAFQRKEGTYVSLNSLNQLSGIRTDYDRLGRIIRIFI